MGIQINGNTDTISAVDGGLTVSGASLGSASASSLNISGIVTATEFSGNVTGNLTGTASTATSAATAYGLSGSPTLSGITSVSTTNLTVNGNAYPSDGVISGARNRIINGDMRIDQRNNGGAVTGNAAYSVDRWYKENGTDGGYSVQRSGVAPVGFTSSLSVTVTSTDTSLGASQYSLIYQHIEGNNLYDLDFGLSTAQPVTLSFWVRSSLTGTFGGSFRSGAQVGTTRSYPFTYSISTADTWEYKTITIEGDTNASGGTWVKDNGRGATIFFSLGTGSSLSGTAGSWASANYLAATGETNLLATNGATWYITGVQLEAGTVATPFERRSYGQELALCQRYYFVADGNLCWSYNTSSVTGSVTFPVPMRASPTGSYRSGTAEVDPIAGGNITPSSISVIFYTTDNNSTIFNSNNFSGLTSNRVYWNRNLKMQFAVEL